MAVNTIARRTVNVINLGRMGYLAAHDVQMRYAKQHLDELAGKPFTKGKDMLLLVEHRPVYTVGIRRETYSEEDEEWLKSHGAEFYRTNRGGLITFHGPGQLVAYPILNLHHFKPSIRWYISALENTIVSTCQHFGLTAKTTHDRGAWVNNKKIAAVGVHGRRNITFHGCSLNCNTDLRWYKYIVPCGLEGKEVTSLSKETKDNISIKDAINPFLNSFQEIFNCDLEYDLMESQDVEAMNFAQQVVVNPPTQNIYSMRQMSTYTLYSPFKQQT